jgi:hypothetical protein
MSYLRPLSPRAPGIIEWNTEDYRGSVNGQHKDHGPLRTRRGGSYGPCPPLERILCAIPKQPLNQSWR